MRDLLRYRDVLFQHFRRTTLFCAMLNGDVEIMKLLVGAGANLEAKDKVSARQMTSCSLCFAGRPHISKWNSFYSTFTQHVQEALVQSVRFMFIRFGW
jgi:hypothetical protein